MMLDDPRHGVRHSHPLPRRPRTNDSEALDEEDDDIDLLSIETGKRGRYIVNTRLWGIIMRWIMTKMEGLECS
jgi:hypothetical protein